MGGSNDKISNNWNSRKAVWNPAHIFFTFTMGHKRIYQKTFRKRERPNEKFIASLP